MKGKKVVKILLIGLIVLGVILGLCGNNRKNKIDTSAEGNQLFLKEVEE
ncbi:hypothetical protein [Clostridium tarantellae]|nr:hypothetical protein [Clostridium tarantellae]